MKIREDFVTNSSSSSFVIAYKPSPEFDEDTLTKYPFLKKYRALIEKVLLAAGDEDTTEGIIFSTKEEYDDYFVSYYGDRDEDTLESILEDNKWLTDKYSEEIEWLKKGFNILYKRVDYSDSYCENMLRELAHDSDNFVILEAE